MRWERRDALSPSWFEIIKPESGCPQVCFLLEKTEWDVQNHWLGGKSGQLLRNILQALSMPQSQLAIIFANPCGMATMAEYRDSQLRIQLQDLQPKVLFVMGKFTLNDVTSNIPSTIIISSPSLNTLLCDPLQKKQAFQYLFGSLLS